MKKLLSLLTMALLIVSVLPMVIGVSIGSGIGVDIVTEDFEPLVWQCGHRVTFDDFTEPGRLVNEPLCVQDCYDAHPDLEDIEVRDECIQRCREVLHERTQNYAFEGEQISWLVLVMDKNGVEKIEDVFATIGSDQGTGNDIEVNCDYIGGLGNDIGVKDSCNARILEESVEWNDDLMAYYMCTLTVETPLSMYDEHWVTVEATDLDGLSGIMAENEYWFLNPEIALSIVGDLEFEDVRPGTSSYSETLLVGNDADDGSGVLLDMFISGTDFYDSDISGAMCPTTNRLGLNRFRYHATLGSYSTNFDDRADEEGYVGINYGIGFNDPNPFYGSHEILQSDVSAEGFYAGNILSPGAEMALTFRLDLPEPCNGDFDTGSIYFWGEAI